MYEVLYNGKPAVMNFGPWSDFQYATLDEASDYAHAYLGVYSPGNSYLAERALNKDYDYSGYGDCIRIVSP